MKCARGMLPVPVVLTNYVTYRRHSHGKYVEPARQTCDLVVDGAPGILALWRPRAGSPPADAGDDVG